MGQYLHFNHLIDSGQQYPGIVALAVFKLMTSSKRVGCWIGRSTGFSRSKLTAEQMYQMDRRVELQVTHN